MTLYSLIINGVEICRIEMEVVTGLPIRPRVNQVWLRAVVSQALREHFGHSQPRNVVKA